MALTPTEIETLARSQFNATNDSFFTSSEILSYMWQACRILAREAKLIESIYSTSTVASTQGYSYPSNTMSIKRVTCGGRKLKRITFRQDDAVTLSNSTSSTTGWPVYYTDFNSVIYLRPIPDTVYTLQIYSINNPSQITASSTLEIPSLFEMDLVNYILSVMYAKDQNAEMATYYQGLWMQSVIAARRYKSQQKREDSFTTVESEDILPVTILGEA